MRVLLTRPMMLAPLMRAAIAAALVICAAMLAAAQTSGRSATTAAALRSSPVFFHGKQIAVLGSVVESRGLFRLEPQATAAARTEAGRSPPEALA